MQKNQKDLLTWHFEAVQESVPGIDPNVFDWNVKIDGCRLDFTGFLLRQCGFKLRSLQKILRMRKNILRGKKKTTPEVETALWGSLTS